MGGGYPVRSEPTRRQKMWNRPVVFLYTLYQQTGSIESRGDIRLAAGRYGVNGATAPFRFR
jgi:hypothetical protein